MNLLACVFKEAPDAGIVARRLQRAGPTSDCPGWAVVRWDGDASRPCSEISGPDGWDATNLAWFWSLVLGITFRVPLLGAAVGSATGLHPQLLRPVGVHDTFVNRLRDEVTPGRSALSVLTGSRPTPTVDEAVRRRDVLVLTTVPLTTRQQTALLGAVT